MNERSRLERNLETLRGRLLHCESYDDMAVGTGEHGEGLTWWALTDEQKDYWIKAAEEQGDE